MQLVSTEHKRTASTVGKAKVQVKEGKRKEKEERKGKEKVQLLKKYSFSRKVYLSMIISYQKVYFRYRKYTFGIKKYTFGIKIILLV